MEFRTLRYFLTVAREENLTKAAHLLYITQPALTKQMQELEKELDKNLFIRGKRKIILTDDGRLLKKRAEEIIDLMEKTEKEMSSDSKEISGEIAIGGSFSEYIIQIATKMRSQYPRVHFYFYTGDANDIADKINNGTLDFAVFIEPIDLSKYEHVSLPQKDVWGFLMRKNHPLANRPFIIPKDIENMAIITHHRKELQHDLSCWSGKEIDQLNIVATYNVFYHNLALFVRNNLGCAFVTKSFYEMNHDEALCFIPIKPTYDIQYILVWKKGQIFSKASQKFLDFIIQSNQDH